MRTVALTTTAVAMAISSLWLVPPPAGADPDRPTLTPVAGVSWQEVLDRAVTAASTTTYEASMVVVTLDAGGPGVTQVEVRKGRDGDLSVAASESWLIARDGTTTMFRDDEAGQLLHVGQVHAMPFAMAEVDRNYDVEVLGRTELATGSAIGVGFRRDGTLRERFFVDDRTDVVVRRETYAPSGAPVRVTALTDLRITDVTMDAVAEQGDEALGTRTRLAPDEVAAMEGHEWPVPTSVGDGFDLRAGYAVDGDSAVQLVYSDGLYTLSVLEQPGTVDVGALGDAVREVHDGIEVYRWPGTEPLRMVWNGDEHTFTAVTDAPVGVLVDVVADLPHDRARSMPSRVGRGLARLGDWLWPF